MNRIYYLAAFVTVMLATGGAIGGEGKITNFFPCGAITGCRGLATTITETPTPRCDSGWSLVLGFSGKPMCAWVLKDAITALPARREPTK